MSGHVRVSGEWKDLSALYARISGEWKELTEGWARVSGEWQKIWEKILYLYNLGAYEDNWTEGYASSIGNGSAVMEKEDTYLHMNVQTGAATLENDGTVFIDNTATTSWQCPEGVTQVDVECWGGGGRGGVHPTGPCAGGGGGAYAKKTGILVSGSTSYTIKIGAGGTIASGDGQETYFKNASDEIVVKAAGGKCGILSTGGLGGAASDCVGDTKYSGGNGASVSAGGGGGAAGSTGNGNNASGSTGGAAKSEYGGAGGNGGYYEIDGSPGQAYGGGGGGGGQNANPGNGYKGCMRITKYKPVSPYRERTWVTVDAVDLTNYSSVKALVTKAGDTTGVTGDLIASTNKTGARTVYNARQSFTSNGEATIELDVSGLSGSHYIRIHGSATGENKEIDLEIAKVMVS